ncbi:hypothetical protein CRG98_032607 [Punica granatum]|uniref:Uncharacterized protein n=1 Tax=Punica granatum TaxID=22663 RepID=A0A2I0ISL3_PUNGR|nr:hypothetical protein CRG98_032607 [Punica granatum]
MYSPVCHLEKVDGSSNELACRKKRVDRGSKLGEASGWKISSKTQRFRGNGRRLKAQISKCLAQAWMTGFVNRVDSDSAILHSGRIRPKPGPNKWAEAQTRNPSPARPFFLLSSLLNPNFSPASSFSFQSDLRPLPLIFDEIFNPLLRASIDGPPPASFKKLACLSFHPCSYFLCIF